MCTWWSAPDNRACEAQITTRLQGNEMRRTRTNTPHARRIPRVLQQLAHCMGSSYIYRQALIYERIVRVPRGVYPKTGEGNYETIATFYACYR